MNMSPSEAVANWRTDGLLPFVNVVVNHSSNCGTRNILDSLWLLTESIKSKRTDCNLFKALLPMLVEEVIGNLLHLSVSFPFFGVDSLMS